MKINTNIEETCLIVRMEGELDMDSAVKFKEKVIPLLTKNKLHHLILNLSRVNFIDSTGLGAILGRYRVLEKQGGKVIIIGIKPQVERIFSLSGMLKIMPQFENEKKALNKINNRGEYNFA
jgi:stage II sporulation protein AA (anti-sigma F factor antagonist)